MIFALKTAGTLGRHAPADLANDAWGTPTAMHKDECLEVAFAAYAALPPGMVAVYDTSTDPSAAHWGEMISLTTS